MTVLESTTDAHARTLPGCDSVFEKAQCQAHGKSVLMSRGAQSAKVDTKASTEGHLVSTILPSPLAVRQHLECILESPSFINSVRLSRFLRFVVERVLSNNHEELKEYLIGSEVYDRTPPYNPSQDSIVRTEARRLRLKLKEYYAASGKHEPIQIEFHPGSYIPAFKWKQCVIKINSANSDELSITRGADTSIIAILPFRDISRSCHSSILARGIPDELAYTLARDQDRRVISAAAMGHFDPTASDLTPTIMKAGATLAYEGSVREERGHIRVTAGILNQNGIQLWTHRFDVDAQAHAMFELEEYFAYGLARGLQLVSCGGA